MHACLCLYVCMWVVCVLKPGKIRGSRRQPHGATPPRRRGDGRPHPLPPHPTCWRALGRPPCPQPAAALTHEHWRAAKRSLGKKQFKNYPKSRSQRLQHITTSFPHFESFWCLPSIGWRALHFRRERRRKDGFRFLCFSHQTNPWTALSEF